jgi:hypothetical protein
MPSVMVSLTWPSLLRTIRHPACEVDARPFADRVLPTTTQPPGSTSRAVVRPTPPGQAPGSLLASMSAKRRPVPAGRDLDDRPAPALLVQVAVEVTDQHVARVQVPRAVLDDENAVRILIAVGRHGRDESRECAEMAEIGIGRNGLRRCGGSSGKAKASDDPAAAPITAAMRCRAGIRTPFEAGRQAEASPVRTQATPTAGRFGRLGRPPLKGTCVAGARFRARAEKANQTAS